MKIKGYTLMEILIALSVFSLLAIMTSASMYHAFDTRDRVNKQTDKLNQIQMSITLLQQDTLETIERYVRRQDMQLSPSFIGDKTYVEFTRGGVINPKSVNKKSTLQRIAYECKNGQLIRYTWEHLDTLKKKPTQKKILLNNLSKCELAYISTNNQVLSEWRASLKKSTETPSTLPKALRLTIALPEWGDAVFLFIIPPGSYV